MEITMLYLKNKEIESKKLYKASEKKYGILVDIKISA